MKNHNRYPNCNFDYPYAFHVVIDREHLRKHSNVSQLLALASVGQRPRIEHWVRGATDAPILVFSRALFNSASEPNAEFAAAFCEDAATAARTLLQHTLLTRLASAQTLALTEYFVMLSDAGNRREVRAALATLPNCSEASKS